MSKNSILILLAVVLSINGLVAQPVWSTQTSNTTQNLLAITSSTDTVAYAFGTSGHIRRTSNAGFNWANPSSSSSSFNGAASLSDTSALACGNGGNTYRITTFGSSIQQISALSANALYAVDAFNANQLCVVGSGGAIATSSNAGVSWTVQTSGITTDFRGIDCVNATTAYAVGSGGVIRKTTDNGVTWAAQTSGSAQTLVGVSFVSVTHGWVVGAAGTILTTSNGGTTWISQTSGTTVVLRDVHFISTTQGWIVGDNGTILYTTNGGTTWTTQVSGTTQQLNAISMASATTGWIAGHAGTILVYCAVPAQPGAITGATVVCQNSTQNYTINPVSGAYNYQWSVPAGWNIAGGGNTNSVTIDQIQVPNGTISVRTNAKGCSSAATTLALTVNAAPQTTGPITGPVTTCSGTTQAYSIGALPGITSYTWTLPNGWSGTPSFMNMSAVVGNSGGTISVVANNGLCSSFPPSTLTVAVNASPTQPGSVSGNTNVCAGSNQSYSITPVSGAVSYSWVLPGGWSGTSTTTSITTTATGNGGNIRVASVNGCGTSAYSNLAVTANIISTPTISISTANTTICQNATINFSSTTTNGGSSPGYQWKKNGNNISGATSAVHSTSLLSDGDVISCVFTSNAACATPTSVTSNSITVTVTSLIVPTVSISATQSTICSGNSVTFTATPNNATLAPAYQWKRNGNNIGGATSATYSTASLANNDQISCELTTNANCVSPNSATSNIITIAVSGTVTPAISIAASTDSVCPGQSVTLTATPTNGGASPSYQWKKNGNNISGATSSAYAASSLLSTDIFSCQLTSSVGCASPTTATSNSLSVVVKNTFAPSVSIQASVASVCEGATVNFNSSITGGGDSPIFQWKLNGNPISGETSPTFISSTLLQGDAVTLQLTSNAACAVPAVVTSSPAVLTIQPLVTPAVSIAASQTTVCTGASVTFTAAITNGGSAPSYQWKINGSDILGETSSTFTSTALADGDVVSLEVTGSETCVTTQVATSAGITIIENSNVIASVSILSSDSSVCSGQAVVFTAAPLNGGASPVFQWKKNNVNISGANASTYTSLQFASSDVVKCEMTSNASCVQQPVVVSNEVSITVNSLPDVSVTQSGNTLSVPAAALYQWFDCGNNTDVNGANALSYTAASNGNYAVRVSNSFGCADTSDCVNVTGVGLPNMLSQDLSIGPNPFQENILLSIPDMEEKEGLAELYDLTGRLIHRETLQASQQIIYLAFLAQGTYLLKVTCGDKVQMKELVKQ